MRILLIIGAVLALYWSIRILAKSSPQAARVFMRNVVIALIVLVCLFLLFSGRLSWLGALLLAALPLLRRVLQWLPWLRRYMSSSSGAGGNPGNSGSGPRVSTVSARYLTMRLNQESGEIDGEIIEGQFQGRRLSELGLEDLLRFNAEIVNDADSCALLQAYLDRIYPDWRQQSTQSQRNPVSSSDMDLTQALEILGLPDNPTREEVIKAHRRLMQKLHPDQGGSTYLATKVNLAKKCVLDFLDAR